MNSARTKLLLLAVLLSALSLCAGEADPSVLANLVEWKDSSYAQRYFVTVIPPPAAGAIGLQPEPEYASVLLPARIAAATGKFEPILLIGEDGASHSVQVRQSGSEMEVLFRTHAQMRRFCIYTSPTGEPKRVSPVVLEPVPVQVRMRGRSAPPAFAFTPQTPLTLERFQKLEERGDGAAMPPRTCANINDPECPKPYFNVKTDEFGRVLAVNNPQNYVAAYEAFLRVPMDGSYKFALDTMGVAHLLIDGTLVVSASAPDPRRLPFDLNKTIELKEGLHRVVLFYADAPTQPGQTSMSLSLFGVRLHWQPPMSKSLLCIPPQAFPHALPSVVTRAEGGKDYIQPFINVDDIGHVRGGAHLGPDHTREFVRIMAKAINLPQTCLLKVSAPGMLEICGAPGQSVAAWVPAGAEVRIDAKMPDGNAIQATRILSFPASKDPTERIDLEAELVIKSAPDFFYPDETGHVHVEALLSPAPFVVPKARIENKLLPPAPRPMGEFRVIWELATPGTDGLPRNAQERDVTPLDGLRRKLLVTLADTDLATKAIAGKTSLLLRLSVGDAEIETLRLHLLHSAAPWPVPVIAGAGNLFVDCRCGENGRTPATLLDAGSAEHPVDCERIMMLVPGENESEYRRYARLKAFAAHDADKDALFLGDPLVEGVAPKPNAGELFGLGKDLSALITNKTWQGVCIPGPHRDLPVFRMIAALESYTLAHGGKIPGFVVVSLGAGDVARQTPLYAFERACDVLVDRLRLAGARQIVFVGVLPEPERLRQCAPYSERLHNLLQKHHLDCVDVFGAWSNERNWENNYALDPKGTLLGPVPNPQARDSIAKMVKDRL
ncbi:MAG TPA: hypothetical protein VGP72_18090 [Planctomycetota bacterium]|jgi:hypothetical protein